MNTFIHLCKFIKIYYVQKDTKIENIIHNIVLLLRVKNKANIYLNSIFFMCIKMLFCKSIVTIYNLTIQLLFNNC